jgi:hypothetical protein
MLSRTSRTIEIINAFHGRVNDIMTVEGVAMKKPKMVVDLLAVTDTCIEASEAQTHSVMPRREKSSPKRCSTQVVEGRSTTTRRSDEQCILGLVMFGY